MMGKLPDRSAPRGGGTRKRLRDLLAAYLDSRRALNMSPHTVKNARYSIQSFLLWLESQSSIRYVDQLRHRQASAWLRHLNAYRTSRGRPLKPRSINKKIECVMGFMRYLTAEGYAQRGMVDAFEYVKEPSFLPGSVLTHEQMQKLLGVVSTQDAVGYRDRTMLELLYSSGIRVAELLGLDTDHLDLKYATAMVTGKGRKQRVVPIGKTALKYVEGYLVGVRPHLVRGGEERALFIDSGGGRMPYHTLRRNLHAYAGRAGLEMTVTPHTFRRSCTTEMLRGGANMYHVKEMLGHESLDTLKHYARLTITDLKKTHAKCHPRERKND